MNIHGDEIMRKGISRRDFLKNLTILCSSGVVGLGGPGLWTGAAEASTTFGQEKTMEAFADTIIPGPDSDPEGSVGGVEAGALAVLYDPYYRLTPFIGTLYWDLNVTSLLWYCKFFKDLDLSQRTEIVRYKDNNSPITSIYEQAEILVELAFYGAIINDVGTQYISFPGPSPGYYHYSFNEQYAEEATDNGNLP